MTANQLKKAYNTSHALADSVWNLVKIWDIFSQTIIGTAFIRSLDNTTIALAQAAQTNNAIEIGNYVRNAKEEAIESLVWLDKARRRKLIIRQDYQHLYVALLGLRDLLNEYKVKHQKVSKLQEPS